MTAILAYDAACTAIARAKSFDEVRDWEDKAAAVREYSRRANNRELEIDAAEIRLRAQRRRGELLTELRMAGRLAEGRPRKPVGKTVPPEGPFPRLTLAELDISKNESSRDQRLAAVDGGSFERLVARCRSHLEAEGGKVAFNLLRETDKKEVRAERERRLAERQCALPDARFGVIYADPEWQFQPFSRESGMDRAADNHYPTSATEAICARPVGTIAADDSVLFLWATVPMLPDALKVMAAWGFAYKSHCVWSKDKVGTGYWFRSAHELLLVGTRGRIPAPAMGTQWPSVIEGRVGRHSEKPERFYELIEAYFPNLPKIELNARRARVGWHTWGNEAPATADGAPIVHDGDGEIVEAADLSDRYEVPVAYARAHLAAGATHDP